ASTYALCVLQHPGGVGSFTNWATFEKDFWAEFFPIDPAKSATLALRNKEQYGQRKQTLDEYINSFWALVEQAAYSDGLQLCLMFWDGLHPTLMERINNLAEDCLDNKQVAFWYKIAWDQWQLMEIQQKLCQAPHSLLHFYGNSPASCTSTLSICSCSSYSCTTTSTPRHSYRRRHGLATSPCTATVLTMQKAGALCMALLIGPGGALPLYHKARRAPSATAGCKRCCQSTIIR
ncbi:hypothetical protein C0993_002270, partial [Termitomyces sp. T159_Od127]